MVSLDEGERVCVVIVESLLLMMVGLERGPLYMINQLLSILSGVDIKVRNTCTCNDVHVIIIIVHVLHSISSSLYPLYGPSLSLLELSGLLKLMKELIQKVKEHDERNMDTNKEGKQQQQQH